MHLLTGTGTAQRRLVESTLAALAGKGYEDVRRQEGGDWASLLSENRGGGLFDARSVVVVEEAEKLGAMSESLASLLETEAAAVHILLVAKSETPQLLPKALAARYSRAKAAEPTPWSKDRDDAVRAAAKKHGLAVRHDAVSLLKELFEDVGELAGETEKLALACILRGGREIATEDVESLCLSDGSKSLLKLLDGICNGRAQESLHSLENLSRGAELLPTVSALHNRIRLAFYLSAFPQDRGDIVRALGAKDYAMRQAEQAARIYGSTRLRDFIVGLIRINANEKTGLGASWRDLNVLVLELLSPVRRDV